MAQHNCTEAKENYGGKFSCPLLIAAYVFAGLAMMLNIRLSYSSAPYALIRFRLPENLFSVFVRRMASALELWCLPSMLLGNIMDLGVKGAIGSANEDNKKWWKFYCIIWSSIICQWLNFITYVILLIVYVIGGDQGRLTTFYWTIAISGVVFGINMTLVYSVDFYYIPVYIAGENSFPIVTSFMHYLSTLMFGNRRKWNSDYLIVMIDIGVAIIISFAAAVIWTVGYLCEVDDSTEVKDMKHIHANGFDGKFSEHLISPFLMVIVGMGLVYAIYPGIAPGMIVPFYLIDKIEMVLLIATFFPPVIIAILRKHASDYSPTHFDRGKAQPWSTYTAGVFYLSLNILMVIKILLAAIFICSLHYRDSSISRSIVNQPKMSTALSITFYMCHEILLAVGFSGVIGNDGGDFILIPQYIGALFMIFLAFYSEGYINEYKNHDPEHWSID
ncbi:Tpr-related protein family member, putative [Theileria annulata]|uniref:Tpr-related protein family member, putative n=1 Tax=Theileria annulata TaxID=5874 RepID=Q4UHQ2_THEAN|nr:Tpr-related protein family member, putative [Theileria annulata]CAI73387.1 Tpr-related protein family member, putative [Theileria annulata]|eukprot:XP_954064.1 Tpr-related protein family member, putative [Theileria annulata]